MIEIDGSLGEGGGQILRSSLALSLCTGRALRVSREAGPMGLSIDLKGEARLTVKGSQPTKLELKGPIKVASANDPKMPKLKVDGNGTMSLLMTAK